MEEWLEDPEAPWWAKLRRAQVHISEVRKCVDALQGAGIWSIEREPVAGGRSCRLRVHRVDGWAYRFRINRAIPADLLAAVGDAVANMRSALDYVAYELARHHVVETGGEMGDEEEAATAFPIYVDQASFERFFVAGRQGPVRSRLYGDVERKALQCVQPFALADEARAVGVEPSTDPQDDLLTDHAYRLNAVWNIDKHRRLPAVAWRRINILRSSLASGAALRMCYAGTCCSGRNQITSVRLGRNSVRRWASAPRLRTASMPKRPGKAMISGGTFGGVPTQPPGRPSDRQGTKRSTRTLPA